MSDKSSIPISTPVYAPEVVDLTFLEPKESKACCFCLPSFLRSDKAKAMEREDVRLMAWALALSTCQTLGELWQKNVLGIERLKDSPEVLVRLPQTCYHKYTLSQTFWELVELLDFRFVQTDNLSTEEYEAQSVAVIRGIRHLSRKFIRQIAEQKWQRVENVMPKPPPFELDVGKHRVFTRGTREDEIVAWEYRVKIRFRGQALERRGEGETEKMLNDFFILFNDWTVYLKPLVPYLTLEGEGMVESVDGESIAGYSSSPTFSLMENEFEDPSFSLAFSSDSSISAAVPE